MTPADEALRRLAEGAAGGWAVAVTYSGETPTGIHVNASAADYVVGTSPSVVLALLDRLQRAEDALVRICQSSTPQALIARDALARRGAP